MKLLELVSPEGRMRAERLQGAARPRALEGLRIGLLDNTKPPVDHIMAHLARRLGERFPGASTHYVSKTRTSIPAGARVMADLRARCDVLITALGD